MRTVCAWCSKVIRDGSPPTSHGMCSDCDSKMAVEIKTLEGVTR